MANWEYWEKWIVALAMFMNGILSIFLYPRIIDVHVMPWWGIFISYAFIYYLLLIGILATIDLFFLNYRRRNKFYE